jgi:type III secretion system HrpE/YscL family protein
MSLGVLYSHEGRELRFHGTRIERQAFAVLREADLVLRNAEAAGQALRAQAASVMQEQAEQARLEGLREGHLEGLTAVLGTLDVELRLRELLAERLIDVVEQCVRKLLGDVGPAEVFRQRTRQLLRSAAPEGGVTLHVCPSQAHLARDIVAELGQEHGSELTWIRIRSDDHCEPDALVLETQVGFVDASVALTLAGARDALQQALLRSVQILPTNPGASA